MIYIYIYIYVFFGVQIAGVVTVGSRVGCMQTAWTHMHTGTCGPQTAMSQGSWDKAWTTEHYTDQVGATSDAGLESPVKI